MAASQGERLARLETQVEGLDERIDKVEHTANTAAQNATLASSRLEQIREDLNRVRANLAKTVWMVAGIIAAAVGAAIKLGGR